VKGSPPTLLVRVKLEERPRAIILAATAEDEERLRVTLSRPAARRRLLAAVEHALDDLARRRAA
jgi:hypothetical protein